MKFLFRLIAFTLVPVLAAGSLPILPAESLTYSRRMALASKAFQGEALILPIASVPHPTETRQKTGTVALWTWAAGALTAGSRGFSGLPNRVYNKPLRKIIRNEDFAAVGYQGGEWKNNLSLLLEARPTPRLKKGKLRLEKDRDLKLQRALKELPQNLQERLRNGGAVFVIMKGLDARVKQTAVRMKLATLDQEIFGSHYGLERPHYYLDADRLEGSVAELLKHLKHEVQERYGVLDKLQEAGRIESAAAMTPRQERDITFRRFLYEHTRRIHAVVSGIAQKRRERLSRALDNFKLREIQDITGIGLSALDHALTTPESLEETTWRAIEEGLRALPFTPSAEELQLLLQVLIDQMGFHATDLEGITGEGAYATITELKKGTKPGIPSTRRAIWQAIEAWRDAFPMSTALVRQELMLCHLELGLSYNHIADILDVEQSEISRLKNEAWSPPAAWRISVMPRLRLLRRYGDEEHRLKLIQSRMHVVHDRDRSGPPLEKTSVELGISKSLLDAIWLWAPQTPAPQVSMAQLLRLERYYVRKNQTLLQAYWRSRKGFRHHQILTLLEWSNMALTRRAADRYAWRLRGVMSYTELWNLAQEGFQKAVESPSPADLGFEDWVEVCVREKITGDPRFPKFLGLPGVSLLEKSQGGGALIEEFQRLLANLPASVHEPAEVMALLHQWAYDHRLTVDQCYELSLWVDPTANGTGPSEKRQWLTQFFNEIESLNIDYSGEGMSLPTTLYHEVRPGETVVLDLPNQTIGYLSMDSHTGEPTLTIHARQPAEALQKPPALEVLEGEQELYPKSFWQPGALPGTWKVGYWTLAQYQEQRYLENLRSIRHELNAGFSNIDPQLTVLTVTKAEVGPYAAALRIHWRSIRQGFEFLKEPDLANREGAFRYLEAEFPKFVDAASSLLAHLPDERLRATLMSELHMMQWRADSFIGSRGSFDLIGDPQPTDVVAIAQDIVNAYATRLKNSTLTVNVQPGLFDAVVDPRHLREILDNLFRNAVEANKRARNNEDINLTISIGRGQGRIYLVVNDSGPGVRPDIGNIFERGISGKDGSVEIRGVGLDIVKKMIQAVDGDIDLSSFYRDEFKHVHQIVIRGGRIDTKDLGVRPGGLVGTTISFWLPEAPVIDPVPGERNDHHELQLIEQAG